MNRSVLLAALALAAPLAAQVTPVQTVALTASTTTTATPTLATASGSGNMLLVVGEYSLRDNNARVLTVTSPHSVWHKMLSTPTGYLGTADLWCAVPTAAETAVTVTQSDNVQPFLSSLMEVHGAAASCGAISQFGYNTTTTASTPLTTPSITPAQTGALPVSWVITELGGTFGQSAGWSFAGNNSPPSYPYASFAVATHAASANTTTAISDAFTTTINAGDNPNSAVEALVLIPPAGTLPVITVGGTLANGTAQRAYSSPVTVSGGLTPYSCTGTGLPGGLSFTGVTLAGQPAAAGTYTPTITCTDSSSPAATGTGTLPAFTIAPEPPLAVTNTSLTVRAGQAFNWSLQLTGGSQVYSTVWTGTLPPNTFYTGKSNDGIISGSLGTTQGTYTLNWTATDTSSPALALSGTATLTVTAAAAPPTVASFSAMTTGTNGAFNGVVLSPDDFWHADISKAAVDTVSSYFMNVSPVGLSGFHFYPNWGTGYGIPYTVVDSSVVPTVPMTYQAYGGDAGGWPLTTSQAIEDGYATCPFTADPNVPNGNHGDTSDHHALVLDRAKAAIYEGWVVSRCGGAWAAANGAIWDATITEQRPYGETSADAAGLSLLEGLARYDEIVAGVINHAIRFTMNKTNGGPNNGYFIAPATHAAGNLGGTIPTTTPLGQIAIEGMRLRLQANFDISGYSATNQIILRALKKYGMIVADNGRNMAAIGTIDSRWNDADLFQLTNVPASAFDLVGMGPVNHAGTAPTGAAPTISSITASATTVAPGTPVTLTVNQTGASYITSDCTGLMRGGVGTFTPTATTTCTAYASNAYPVSLGADVYYTTSSPVTITVSGSAPAAPTLTLGSLASFTQGVLGTHTLAVSGGVAPYAFTASSLPAGISLSSAGVVTVAATVAGGSYTLGVSATDSSPTPGTVAGNVTALVVASVPVVPGVTGAISYTPPKFVLAMTADGGATYAPLTMASGIGPVNSTPLFFTPMCSATGLPPFTQCVLGGSGAGTSASPTGTAGGDLSGTYPNPTVAKVNGAAVPVSLPVVGTNALGQIVAGTAPQRSVSTSSLLGSLGDSVCTPGSQTTGTDRLAALQSAINGGQVSLIVDGTACYTLSGPLKLASNTYVEIRPGSGFVMAPASNAEMFSNVNENAPTTASGTGGFLVSNQVDHDITIINRGTMNFNSSGTSTTGAAVTGYDSAGWTGGNVPHKDNAAGKHVVGVFFSGVDKLNILEGVQYDSATFSNAFSNCSHVEVWGQNVSHPTPAQYGKETDGNHFWGPEDIVYAHDLTGTANDDFLAYNADDSGNPNTFNSSFSQLPGVRWGPITNVSIQRIRPVNSYAGIRLLSLTELIDKVVIDDVSGSTVVSSPFKFNHFFPSGGVGNYGRVSVRNVSLVSTQTQSFDPVQAYFDLDGNWVNFDATGVDYRNPSLGVPLIRYNAGTMQHMGLSTFSVFNPTGVAIPSVFQVGGLVSRLTVGGLNLTTASGWTGNVFAGGTVATQLSCSAYNGPGSTLPVATTWLNGAHRGDCFVTGIPAAATAYVLQTAFNEGASGAALTGTRPATYTGPSTGWLQPTGAASTYNSGGGAILGVNNTTDPTQIDVGKTNYTMTFTMATFDNGNTQIRLRYKDSANYIALIMRSNLIDVYDGWTGNSSGFTNLGTTSWSPPTGAPITVTLNGSSLTISDGVHSPAVLTLATGSTNTSATLVGITQAGGSAGATVFSAMTVQ